MMSLIDDTAQIVDGDVIIGHIVISTLHGAYALRIVRVRTQRPASAVHGQQADKPLAIFARSPLDAFLHLGSIHHVRLHGTQFVDKVGQDFIAVCSTHFQL